MTIYWLAMAEILYTRCYPGVFPWKSLRTEDKEFWVKLAQEAKKLFESSPPH
jgi:hypothetical protein